MIVLVNVEYADGSSGHLGVGYEPEELEAVADDLESDLESFIEEKFPNVVEWDIDRAFVPLGRELEDD